MTNGDGTRKNNLSWRLFGTLRYIDSHHVYDEDLPKFSQLTLWACCHNKYIARGAPVGKEGRRRIFLTDKGYSMLREYTECQYSARHRQGIEAPPDEGLTERVSALIARARVFQMRKSA